MGNYNVDDHMCTGRLIDIASRVRKSHFFSRSPRAMCIRVLWRGDTISAVAFHGCMHAASKLDVLSGESKTPKRDVNAFFFLE
jgi:hypothetical protein